MSIFTALLFGLAAFYGLLLGSAAVGLRRAMRSSPNHPPENHSPTSDVPSVSVVIPARDEEERIGACLESVLANDYPSDRCEVIVVDDGSTDATGAVVRRYPEVRLIRVEDDPGRAAAHKKHALARGVATAGGRIILTTDADCTVPPGWIRTIAAAFDEKTGIVTGPVVFKDDGTLFGRIQSLEFLGLVALGAGFVGIGLPHLANSANLAYRRRAFDEIGGYAGLEDVTTGDDEMLLHRMAYESRWEVATCMSPDAAVATRPCATVGEFFRQRQRWASAHARYPHRRFTVISAFCYLFFVGLATATFAARWELLGAALVLKIVAEASVLWPAARRFGRLRLMPLLPAAQIVHIPYILIVGFAGTLGGYEWKGRNLAR